MIMKKALYRKATALIIAVLMITVLTACGGTNTLPEPANDPTPTSAPDPTPTPEPADDPDPTPTPEPADDPAPPPEVKPPSGGSEELDMSVIDMSDPSNYFVVIDGVRFDVNTVLQDLIDMGFEWSSSLYSEDTLDEPMGARTYAWTSLSFAYNDMNVSVLIYNPGNEEILVRECLVCSYRVNISTWDLQNNPDDFLGRVYTVNNITIGTPLDAIYDMFDEEPYYEYESEDGTSRSVEYRGKSDDRSKEYEMKFTARWDDGKAVNEIQVDYKAWW